MSADGDAEIVADYVLRIVRGLVDEADMVKIDILAEKLHTNFILTVEPQAFGKVIGKGGAYADAIRTLVKAMGARLRLPSCTLHINDPDPKRVIERR